MNLYYCAYRGPDWDTEVDGKSCTVQELLVELYEKVIILNSIFDN